MGDVKDLASEKNKLQAKPQKTTFAKLSSFLNQNSSNYLT
jgi:hypothetical protein